MTDWVYLTHPDIETDEPARFPDDPEVLRVYESRGWERTDPPEAVPFVPAKADADEDERDIRGVAWVVMQHPETGGVQRVPDEPGVIEDQKDRGWRLASDEDETALDERTVAELKDEIDRRNDEGRDPPLTKTGTKAELIDRLREDDETHPPADSGDTEKE